MPIYEYRCEKCEEEFEVSQRITEDPLTEHEGCGGEVKRLISRTSFTLKGSGWYSDHYGLQPGAGKNGSEAAPASTPASESKTETKGDSKPEAKAEAKAEPAKKVEKKKEKPAS